MRVWVTLGYFDERGDGAVVELDAVSRRQREVLRFAPPPELTVAAKGFTGACWTRSRDLLVCGSAAVFRFSGASLAHEGTLALPSFNDLHGVHVHADRIYVVNTGLDCVDVFSIGGAFIGNHSFEAPWLTAARQVGAVPTRDTWHRVHAAGFGGDTYRVPPADDLGSYYRAGRSTPFNQRQQRDFVHPNHVCVVDGKTLVTSLIRRSVIDVASWETLFSYESAPHDGVAVGGRYYVTRIDGYVEGRPLGEATTPELFDVTELSGITGWCRGLHVTDELMWVGFTEIREQPGQPWNRGRYEATRTAVAAIHRVTQECVARFDLSAPGRHSKVFSILEAK